MKKVLVCCTTGVSTSLLVSKMQNVAKERGLDYQIEAYPISKAVEHLSEADAVLLSPQVAFAAPNIKEGSQAPVAVIDDVQYASADAGSIVDSIAELLG